jgi:hypothetical protein
MPIIRSTEMNQQTAYDVQHWLYCVRLAEKRQVRVHMNLPLAQNFSGIIIPIIRSTEVNQQTAYDVQHWSCCVRLAEKRQVLVHMNLPLAQTFSGIIMPIIRSTEVNQQTAYDVQHWTCCFRLAEKRHTNLPLLCKSNITRPMLYIISGLFVHFCTPDDGHNDGRNMLS